MTTFKTYWDLSEKERAALEQEGVDRFAAAELMSKGVLQVAPPTLDPEPAIAEPPTTTYCALQVKANYGKDRLDILFRDAEAARAFMAAQPMRSIKENLNDDWQQSVAVASPLTEAELVMVDVMTAETFQVAKAALEKRSAVRRANEERTETYGKARKDEQAALAGMYEDWQRCRTIDAAHRKVASTLESYTSTAGGDREVAFRFLRKAFTDPQIVNAAEWCGFEAPGPFVLTHDRIEEVYAATPA